MGKKYSNLQSAFSPALNPTSPPTSAGLYVHIPFCLSKCPYCGFYSTVQPDSFPPFIDALLEEIRLTVTQDLPSGKKDGAKVNSWLFDTVYFGGGTPSLLQSETLEIILNQINRYFHVTSDSEITIETNPGDGELSYFQNIFAQGINRLNLGVQSFDDKILRFLGRRHNSEQARLSIKYARESGFKNLGLDLIYGLPEQTINSWLDALTTALSFTPEHLSCYQLTIEENTPFASEVEKGSLSLPEEETQRQFFLRTSEFLEEAGYLHYEVSNFAREEKYFSRHNQKYWNHTPYIGLGPAAHSFDGSSRRWNFRSVDEYISALRKGNLPVQDRETLTEEQLMFEDVFLGLRTRRGIHLPTIRAKYSHDLLAEKGKLLSAWQKEGLIEFCDGYLRPTRAGLAVADRLALL